MTDQNFKCGYVAIIGRPNMGKSTLLNHMLGLKLSITSRKPQTTRHQILGVKTVDNGQFIFVDTPGIHSGGNRAINRYMNRAASSVIHDVDVVLFLVQAMKWTDEDELVLKKLEQVDVPVVLLVNKVDKIADKDQLLPFIAEISEKYDFANVMPISATQGHNVQQLEDYLLTKLPEASAYFQDDEFTDRSTRFLVAEIIREKLVRELGNELPYQTTVEIEQYKDEEKITRIHALILVETKGQKVIVIGDKGARLKSIGTKARKDIENLIDRKVFLKLWVKVKSGWSDSEASLRSLGYDAD
ncbi:MAG: GTPase Era [endosymbiont of Galathealinum brachiosum]|uniref:GTPase Era n=1 Tax=endosymbiont of Galathealinum brachiosum TaxID=2200906 RepID=A0A370DIQ2_9GAMM|nr:MAG: GTPase Era [endosymbiont of Galathealinum brachiosum]